MRCTVLILTMLALCNGFAFSKKATSKKRAFSPNSSDVRVTSATTALASSPRGLSAKSPLFRSGSSLKQMTDSKKKLNSELYSTSSGIENSDEDSRSSITVKPTTTIREKLSKISNIASMLCVIDCTVLPTVTVLLPLIGLGASPAQAKWLHELGHSVAIYFVLPVGGLAATMNSLSAKNPYLSSLAAIGLSMIYAANGHGGPILSKLPHDLRHALHCGTLLHRATNIIGCACLLSSNYFAHKLSCTHDHGDGGHSHSHSCCDHE